MIISGLGFRVFITLLGALLPYLGTHREPRRRVLGEMLGMLHPGLGKAAWVVNQVS